ncbi:helix-turn-helix transcriptional regulator [Streptomyces sp. NPDC008086]|uniref:helix-turn-helix transcriptional regulator n=1 Tax=Streptomyces sp. NPDC008086 TaxID=3364807 RepID=UPI0036E15DB9
MPLHSHTTGPSPAPDEAAQTQWPLLQPPSVPRTAAPGRFSGRVFFDGNTPPAVVGRAQQLREITAFLGTGTGEGGRALLLRGEPGVGKTVMLGEIAKAMSTAGARVLSATGVQFEADLAYAGLHQLLFPLHDRFDGIGSSHHVVLRGALGFDSDPVPDRLLVSHAVFSLLRRAATERPVFVVVDDLPWLDRPSSAVLAFVARRLAGSRIGFLAAARSGAGTFFDGAGLTRYEVPPLDHSAAAELIGARFPGLTARVRRHVLAQAQGNPLALLELPAALSSPQRGAPADLPTVLPLPPSLQTLYASRLSGLPAASQRLLLLLALDGTGDLGVLRIGPEDTVGLRALEAAESEGLIAVDGANRRVTFPHPMIGAAVVEACTLTERCQAHRRLAEVRAEEPERRAWHLGEATLAPDEQVADLLEEAGHRFDRRGDTAGAVATWTRAAELSPRPADRVRRLTAAAYLDADATGELRAASELLDRARRAGPDLSGSPLAAATAAILLLNSGDGDVDSAHRLLVAAIEAGPHGHDAGDDALIEALYTLQSVCFIGGRAALWEPFHAALDRLKPAPPPLLSVCGKTFGDPARTGVAGLKELDSILAGIRDEEDPGQIARAGTACLYADRLADVREASWRVVRQGRRGGPARRHLDALMNLCLHEFQTGEWEEAARLSDEGLRICEELPYRVCSWYFQYNRALLAAVHGRFEASRALADRITRWAVPRGALGVVAFVNHVRVLADLGDGDYEGAYHHAAAISPAGRLASHVPHALWVCMDLVEAAVHTQRATEAEAHVRALQESGVAALSPRLALLVAGSAALVASDDDAPGRFEQALAVPGAERRPFDLARIRLAYGQRLRRMRSVTEAREQLDAASEVFERLDARPWAARATGELRAIRRGRTRATADDVTLTPQELEIAHLAASGLTNKQIAERLFLSPRTVGSHLYQLFPKLGIASRAALRDALTSLP